jgi:hypothetical protein
VTEVEHSNSGECATQGHRRDERSRAFGATARAPRPAG